MDNLESIAREPDENSKPRKIVRTLGIVGFATMVTSPLAALLYERITGNKDLWNYANYSYTILGAIASLYSFLYLLDQRNARSEPETPEPHK